MQTSTQLLGTVRRMLTFPQGAKSPFARAVSAEIRAHMAAERTSIRDLAAAAGFRSHNYLAMRLRDEQPFSLDDVARLCDHWDIEAADFLQDAHERHEERIWAELLQDSQRPEGMTQAEAEDAYRDAAEKVARHQDPDSLHQNGDHTPEGELRNDTPETA